MANRLKMVQKELLFALFAQNWSNRKINNTLGIHRKTIAQYKKEWLENSPQSDPPDPSPKPPNIITSSSEITPESVPLDENKVPTEGVVHFEVPPDSKKPASKSKAVTDVKIYTIQVGAFKAERNALNLAKEINNKGYHTFVVKGKTYYKVQVEEFNTYQEAHKDSLKLKELGYPTFITTK